MPVPYTAWRYFYPPRTNVALGFDMNERVLSAWSKMPDAIAQVKLNGSRNLVVISPEDKIEFWGRHKAKHKIPGAGIYVPPEDLIAKIRALPYPHGKWNIFDTELMHFKTPLIKNSVYFFDTLVWGGEYLLGVGYTERFEHVKNLQKWDYFPVDFGSLNGKIWLAQNYSSDTWQAVWNAGLKDKSVEGLVLKRTGPISRLKPDKGQKVNNGEFMCRVRKPFKNSQF